MDIAIVGSRDFPVPAEAEKAVRGYVRSLPRGTTVVSGGARGTDTWAEEEAEKRGLERKIFPVDKKGLPAYGTKGSKAAYRKRALERNQKIVDAADVLVAFWDGSSTGTEDSIKRAQAAKIPHAVLVARADGTFHLVSTDDPVNLYLEKKDGH